MKIVLELKNNREGKALIYFLKQLDFVKIKEEKNKQDTHALDELFGIWKDKKINKESLREKAWRI